MNFQISVVIWTVICFLILMAILKNLLFGPVLKVLDSRKEKLDSARKKKAEIERLTKEHQENILKQQQEDIYNRKLKAKELAAEIQSQGKKEIDEAQRKCLESINEYRVGIKDEYEQIVESVAPKMETAAAIFAKNIISHRI